MTRRTRPRQPVECRDCHVICTADDPCPCCRAIHQRDEEVWSRGLPLTTRGRVTASQAVPSDLT